MSIFILLKINLFDMIWLKLLICGLKLKGSQNTDHKNIMIYLSGIN